MQLSKKQEGAMGVLVMQANWFAGYFNRQAARIIEAPAND